MSSDRELFLDPSRCIGCQACVHACAECETHRGHSLIHLEVVDRMQSPQTVPVVCMHCHDPACARVCPADAIKESADGIVQSALGSRCISCSNCVLACPFGVPKHLSRLDQMMKCDQCYDRTSQGLGPLCATVCPSGAIAFGRRRDMEAQRREVPVAHFHFGPRDVHTRVSLMVPKEVAARHDAVTLDIADLLVHDEEPWPGGEGPGPGESEL